MYIALCIASWIPSFAVRCSTWLWCTSTTWNVPWMLCQSCNSCWRSVFFVHVLGYVYGRAWNSSRKRGFSRKLNWKSRKKLFFCGKQIDKHTFFFKQCVGVAESMEITRERMRVCQQNRALMEFCSWTFAYFKLFQWWKYTAGPDWSKKFVKPMNINLMEVSHLHIKAGL